MKLRTFLFLCSNLISTKLLASDSNPANIFLVLDAYSQNRSWTESKSSLATKKTRSDETRSTKPGSIFLIVAWEKWMALANISPDPNNSGIVAVGYAVGDGQYLGGAYNLNESKTEGMSNSTKQNVHALAGYHVLKIDDANRVSTFWTLGPSSSRGMADPGTGTAQSYKGSGISVTFTFRYLHVLSENLFYNPALKFNRQTVEQDFSDLKVDRATLRIELVPIGFCFRI